MMPNQPAASPVSAQKAFTLKLVAIVALIDLFVAAFAAWFLHESRSQYQESASVSAYNLSQVLEQNIAGMIGKIDIALFSVQDEIAKQSASGGIDAKKLNVFLDEQQQHQPEVISLRVTDAQGEVRYGRGVAGSPRTVVADRDYFTRARAATAQDLIISKPVFARISRKWAFVLARRITLPDGAFGGVVYVNVALEHVSKLFSRLEVGAHGAITLRDGELGIMVRYPEPQGTASVIGDKRVSPQLEEMLRTGKTSGVYSTFSALDKIERIFSYRRIDAYPLYIFVGLANDDFLREWRDDVTKVIAMLGIFVVTTWLSGWLILRGWKRQLAFAATLADQEAKFRTVADYTYDWEYWQGPDGKILYMTPSCERITGYSQQEFIADPGLLDRIVVDEDRLLLESHLHDCEAGSEKAVDYRIACRNGEIRWIAHGCQAVFDAQGRPMGRRASNRDVTSRKHTEAVELRLRNSLRRLSEIAAFSHLSLDQQFHKALQVGCELFGLEFGIVSHVENGNYEVVAQVSPPDTLKDGQIFPLGMTYCSITLEKNGVLAIPDMGKSSYLGHPCYREFRLETYIGAPIIVEEKVFGTVNFSSPHGYPRQFDEGDEEFITLLARWAGSAIERNRAAQKLAESQLHLQTIIENEPECVKLLAADGTLLQMNRAGLAMLDADSLEQLRGRPLLNLVKQPYRDAFMDLTRRVFAGGNGNLEFEVTGLNGTQRWLDTHAVPLRDADGAIVALLAVTRDITQRKNTEAELHALNTTLEQRVREEVAKNMEQERMLIQQSRLAAMGEMIGNIAHQWRQPLNTLGLLLANIKDAQEYGELDAATLDQSVNTGRQLIEKMSTTIDDFRNFFKPNKEKVTFSLKSVVENTLEIVSAGLKNHNIEVEIHCDEDVTPFGFPNEYSQVLLNLLNNAKDAILARHEENGRIRIRITRYDNQACLSICDNGEGIAAEILPKIFDPYFTTKEKGTGIGLYMSKLIIEDNMGGSITARNVDGGAEFTVTCPLGKPALS